jgi:iron-sulfur cluster repair protein YtfE (RIC family)
MNIVSDLLPGQWQGSSGGGDVVAILEADHRAVEQLFKDIQRATGSARKALVQRLGKELSLHMAIEESLVYPRVSSFDREMGAEAKAEHGLAAKVLRDVQRLSPDDPGFDGALEMLQAGIQHHVHEEEGEVLPKLRQEVDAAEMEQLTAAVRSAKERGRAPRRTSAASRKRATRSGPTRRSTSARSTSGRSSSSARKKSSPAKAAARKRSSSASASRSSGNGSGQVTKAELVRRAKRQGVTGYSSMTKAQLQRALSR